MEASLRTLEEAGLAADIPTILRAAVDKYQRANRPGNASN